MNLDRIHIFIILMLALICSSCLGSFMREGYENENDNSNNDNSNNGNNDNSNNGNNDNSNNGNSNDANNDPQGGTNSKSDNFVRNPMGETYQDGYDDYYQNLDQETVQYSDSKLAKNKRIGPHRPHRSKGNDNNHNNDEDDNDDNNLNSYGNVNKYPNVENDNILMAGNNKRYNHNRRGGGGSGSSVPGSQIPKGSEDLYILKSNIVPPVCPACPAVTTCPTEKKCPPCPPCARCPEPAFECKKVPNYSGQNDSYLPQPVMSDFSQFGL